MPTCECQRINHNRVVASAVADAVKRLDHTALAVVRNGGWELWFRNLLLMRLEQDASLGCIGFTERATVARKRADLMFHCLVCGGATLALELKTNFLTQGRTDRRIRQARTQLGTHLEQETASFLIYTITDLWVEEGDDLYAARHNSVLQRTTYKRFSHRGPSDARRWDRLEGLPQQEMLAQGRLELGRSRALLCVWAARVTGEPAPLTFLRSEQA